MPGSGMKHWPSTTRAPSKPRWSFSSSIRRPLRAKVQLQQAVKHLGGNSPFHSAERIAAEKGYFGLQRIR